MKIRKYIMLGSILALGSLVGACDSGVNAVGGRGGAGPAAGGNPGTAGASGGAGGAAGVPLVDWVTDLTANHTDDISPPDTVDDKVIIDTSDPAAFDPLLLTR